MKGGNKEDRSRAVEENEVHSGKVFGQDTVPDGSGNYGAKSNLLSVTKIGR